MARKKKATAAPAEVMELEQVDKGGMGIDEGIMIATFLLLVGACLIVYFELQNYPVT